MDPVSLLSIDPSIICVSTLQDSVGVLIAPTLSEISDSLASGQAIQIDSERARVLNRNIRNAAGMEVWVISAAGVGLTTNFVPVDLPSPLTNPRFVTHFEGAIRPVVMPFVSKQFEYLLGDMTVAPKWQEAVAEARRIANAVTIRDIAMEALKVHTAPPNASTSTHAEYTNQRRACTPLVRLAEKAAELGITGPVDMKSQPMIADYLVQMYYSGLGPYASIGWGSKLIDMSYCYTSDVLKLVSYETIISHMYDDRALDALYNESLRTVTVSDKLRRVFINAILKETR